MKQSHNLVGVDIGGTKMHFARVQSECVSREEFIPTCAERPKQDIMDDVLRGVESVVNDNVTGIGIGIPGLVDMQAGVVRNISNIPSWKNVEIRREVEERFGIPVFVGNDANCFALGEKYFGKGRGYADLVCLTLGTGVGAGVIVADRLHEGNCAMAGEFGGIKYLDADYEFYCGSKFFSRKHDVCPKELENLAEKGDDKALAIFHEFGTHVGNLLQAIIYSYGPEMIVIGGSLSKVYPFVKGGVMENLSTFTHPHVIEKTKVEISGDPRMPILGAAALAIKTAI